MSDERIRNIENRLTKLEVTFNERWDAHDKRSELRWGQLDSKLEDISQNILAYSKQPLICMKEMRLYVNKQVKMFIGIPASIIAILTVINIIISNIE